MLIKMIEMNEMKNLRFTNIKLSLSFVYRIRVRIIAPLFFSFFPIDD